MNTITRKINGKQLTINVNNSGWVAPGNPEEVVKVLKGLEIKGYNSKGVPFAYDDDGMVIKLGAADCRTESLANHATYKPGTGSSVKDEELRTQCQKGLDYLKKHPDPFLEEIFKALMPEDKTLAKVNKVLDGLTDEQLAAILKARGIK